MIFTKNLTYALLFMDFAEGFFPRRRRGGPGGNTLLHNSASGGNCKVLVFARIQPDRGLFVGFNSKRILKIWKSEICSISYTAGMKILLKFCPAPARPGPCQKSGPRPGPVRPGPKLRNIQEMTIFDENRKKNVSFSRFLEGIKNKYFLV